MMRGELRKLLLVQVVLVLLAALGAQAYCGAFTAAEAALYGGAIALINTLLQARRAMRAATLAGQDARLGAIGLYAGVVERFVFTLAAFAVGMGVLRLNPPALLIGFAVAQLGFVLARPRTSVVATSEPVHGSQDKEKVATSERR